MNVFIAGNGSMGMRRERDLRALGIAATAYDAWPSRGLTPDQVVAFDAADAVVVSTPPTEHTRVAVWADARKMPCFTEADVREVRAPHYPSATPLFTDWYAELSRWAYMAAYTLHVGQHIDDWHPGADPTTYYAYREETAPTSEMIPFELIWLTKLFGPVVKAQGYRDKNVAAVVVRHRLGVTGAIVIDALSRPMIRQFTGIGHAGWQKSLGLTYSESAYREEMCAFLDAAQGRAPWPYSQADEAANLEVLHMIERSA